MAGNPPVDKRQRAFAVGVALGLHVIVFSVLSYIPQKPLSVPTPPIAVKLVIAPPVPEALTAPDPDPIEPKVPELVTPPVEPILEPLEPEPELELEPKREGPVAAIILESIPAPPSPAPLTPKAGDRIPDRWRLPAGAHIPLEKTQQPATSQMETLAKSLDCLGFEADCAVQRKSVFGEEQLSGTDLVWMASQAHSGLSNSDLFGLSEAQIRERLGIPTAGKNGFMILPGIAIDGPWWDALHGVNKNCNYGLGLNENGQKQLVKKCKPLKPSSKDRIGFIPKPVE